MTQTKGQYRVGITFNPSQLGVVDQIKVKAAELIDLIDDLPVPSSGSGEHAVEVLRLKALAATAVEEGAMWGVKAATKQERT